MLQHVVYITCQEPVEACRPDEHPEYGFLEAGITGLTRRCTELCILNNRPFYVVMMDYGSGRPARVGVWYPREVIQEAKETYGKPKPMPQRPDWRNDPATPAQLGYLHGLGYVGPDNITKGEAGLLIDKYKATKPRKAEMTE